MQGQTLRGDLQDGTRPLRCFVSAVGEGREVQTAPRKEENPLPLTVRNAQGTAACLKACRDVPALHIAGMNGEERASHRGCEIAALPPGKQKLGGSSVYFLRCFRAPP